MPNSNPELIAALRTTADRLESGVRYEWGHMARCNCGHLVQTITGMTDRQISCSIDHQLAEWTDYAESVYAGTNVKVDDLFRELERIGFNRTDVIGLENLTDKMAQFLVAGPDAEKILGDLMKQPVPGDTLHHISTELNQSIFSS